jgi:RecJ-like exonuclease
MKTRSLLKLSLITAIVGIFLVVVLANNLEPGTKNISIINEKMIDEWIKVRGNITNQHHINGLTIITIYDGTAGINSIIYKEMPDLEGTEVIILGKIIEYKNELEIQIEKIEIIN